MALMNSADLISSAAFSWTTSFTLLMMISMCFTMRFAISSLALSRIAASAAAWLLGCTGPPLLVTAALGVAFARGPYSSSGSAAGLLGLAWDSTGVVLHAAMSSIRRTTEVLEAFAIAELSL